jgi:hypothetical protein
MIAALWRGLAPMIIITAIKPDGRVMTEKTAVLRCRWMDLVIGRDLRAHNSKSPIDIRRKRLGAPCKSVGGAVLLGRGVMVVGSIDSFRQVIVDPDRLPHPQIPAIEIGRSGAQNVAASYPLCKPLCICQSELTLAAQGFLAFARMMTMATQPWYRRRHERHNDANRA